MRQPQNRFDYRSARKAFIALSQKAGSDSISRVHPWALAPDGKPLFLDSAAFGPREAKKGLLVITGRSGRDGALGAQVLQALLRKNFSAPSDRRLVLIHALNPFGFARRKARNEDGLTLDEAEARQSWSFEMLRAVLREDLARCEKLRVLDVGSGRTDRVEEVSQTPLAEAVKGQRPDADLEVAQLVLRPENAALSGPKAIARALASL